MNIFDKNKPKNKLEFVESHVNFKGYFPCHTMMRNMVNQDGFYKFSGQHNINVKNMKQKEKDAILLLTRNDNCMGFDECYFTHKDDANLPPEYVLLKCFCCNHGASEIERERLSKSCRINEFKKFNKMCVKKDSGFIYFIKSELSGNVKIGKTSNLSKRFSDIKVCDPSVVLLFAIKTENQHLLERKLHSFFYTKRRDGEWFLLSTNDVSYIKEKYKDSLVSL